jgi:hypothetical protein
MPNLFWKNLKTLTCPKCGSQLKTEGFLDPSWHCTKDFCDFSISDIKLQRIVGMMDKGQWSDDEEHAK